jgi:hypothetical protein
MLRGTLAFLVLVACAVAGTELRSALARRGLRAPAMEGLSFLLLGILLGGRALGLFAEDLLESLRVVVLFGLAWLGLVFGVQMELRIIRRLALWLRLAGLLPPLCMGAAAAAAALAFGLEPAVALGVGALAMASSPSSLEGLARGRAIGDRDALRLVKVMLAFSGAPAVCTLLVAAALASPLAAGGAAAVPALHLVLLTVGVGVLVGYAVVVLVRGVGRRIEILTLLTGGMCLVAGGAAVLGLNPLPAAACAGAILVNRTVFPHRVLRAAHSLERPMLVALLVLVGASWSAAAFSVPVFAVMTVVRTAAAGCAGAVLGRAAQRRGLAPRVRSLGLGLLPQGELALGLLVAVLSFARTPAGVLEAVVAAMVVNNLLGGWWMRRRLFAEPRPGAGR